MYRTTFESPIQSHNFHDFHTNKPSSDYPFLNKSNIGQDKIPNYIEAIKVSQTAILVKILSVVFSTADLPPLHKRTLVLPVWHEPSM